MESIENQPFIKLDIPAVEDLIRIIGQASHSKFCHEDINTVRQALINKCQEAIEESKSKLEKKNFEESE